MDRLRQLSRLLVADVTRRGADQPREIRAPLLELAHVEAGHHVLVAEERLGERPGELGLADPGRAEEEEASDRSPGVAEPGAGAADRLGDGGDGFLLAHDVLVERLLQPQEPLSLFLGEL